MSDKTEDQIARERDSVKAMKNAQSNMAAVLSRVETLERALSMASSTISTLKGYIAPGAYTYPHGPTAKRCTEVADEGIAAIAKVLA
ncbi:hypothetical protein [Sphingopyxis sp. Geo48]|uniref:hypothetical protein n=1 Tax=Sphingopyxis sp. Geo48 TaxID=545241 RepID=UPI0024B83D71|nr:hypothetical protein [Sphingopyxis sp. Geo48]